MAENQSRILLPIPDLVLTDMWEIGPVRLHPPGSAPAIVDEVRSLRREPKSVPIDTILDEHTVDHLSPWTVADVTCSEAREGYELVADALAILRLLQNARYHYVNTDLQTFGLPGQATKWWIDYINLSAGPGPGGFRGGPAPGWTFTDDDYAALNSDDGLQFLCGALSASTPTRLQQRALLGSRLLSASTLQQDPDQKLLACVMALEVMTGDNMRGPKKFRLARRHGYLACSVPNKSMCGRDRPSCPYLALDPESSPDKGVLRDLRERANAGEVGVICSDYYRVVELYEARNRTVHDGTVGLELDEVRKLLYPIKRWHVPEILTWYSAHPNDADLIELDEAIQIAAATMPPPPTI